MTEEELNRKMEFIVEQQAQFAVDIQQLKEAHIEGAKRISQLEGAFVSLYNIVTRVGENQKKGDEQLKEMREQLKETREIIDILAVSVERHISGHTHTPLDPS
ncbi:MAG: hypothetical protein ABI977_07495 [Acidobacteriota bacterium]